jgi:hypothetical protein
MTGPFEVTLIDSAMASSNGSKSNMSDKAITTSKTRFIWGTAYLQLTKIIPNYVADQKTCPITLTA